LAKAKADKEAVMIKQSHSNIDSLDASPLEDGATNLDLVPVHGSATMPAEEPVDSPVDETFKDTNEAGVVAVNEVSAFTTPTAGAVGLSSKNPHNISSTPDRDDLAGGGACADEVSYADEGVLTPAGNVANLKAHPKPDSSFNTGATSGTEAPAPDDIPLVDSSDTIAGTPTGPTEGGDPTKFNSTASASFSSIKNLPPGDDGVTLDSSIGVAEVSVSNGLTNHGLEDAKVVNTAGKEAPAFTTPATAAVDSKMTVEFKWGNNTLSNDPSPSSKNLYSIFSTKAPSKSPALTTLGKT